MSGQHHSPATFTPVKDPVPIVQEAGWAPEPVWIGAENLAPTGFFNASLLILLSYIGCVNARSKENKY